MFRNLKKRSVEMPRRGQGKAPKNEHPSRGGLSLVDLSDEVLLSLLEQYLDVASLALVGRTCRRLYSLSRKESLWEPHLEPFLGSRELPPARVQQAIENDGPAKLYGLLLQPKDDAVWKCKACGDSLKSTTTSTTSNNNEQQQQQRCPCVCRRVHMPFIVMGFTPRRCGSSSLAHNFDSMRSELETHFAFQLELVDTLPTFTEEQQQKQVDMLILCTTEGPGLSDEEQQGLIHFVRNGGTAVVTAFSEHSQHGHFNQKLVDWLGIDVIPHSPFIRRARKSRLASLPNGPFPSTGQFVNLGETTFHSGGTHHTSMFFPRGHPRTGLGEVFVVSNYHWIADRHHWHGGRFQRNKDNRHLLLNLAASAAVYQA
ncbi:expressed unknown protein [Seminavis robusta]|uniref:F-box domain-containing protein n=1 Tax=Seminavis robusta TaxID=568900 RepID=A0A9N8ETH2_9STRA|nr:expressed unknown protein [Seminavis robusta]|eukprot:Sro1583_g283980.1 n/a (370) ;mRNA; f:18687-19796